MTDATRRAAAQARLRDMLERLEKEWDGHDAGVREDLEALRIACDALAQRGGKPVTGEEAHDEAMAELDRQLHRGIVRRPGRRDR